MEKKPIREIKKELWQEIEELRDKRGFIQAGLPRYKGLFGRDSLIVSWQLLDIEPEIARKTLEILTEFQGKKIDNETGEEPGKILHEYYPEDTEDKWWREWKEKISWLEKGKPVYMSVDSTPLFLIVLAEYFRKTGDRKFLAKIWPNAKKAIDWLIQYGDKDSDYFLEYQRKGPGGAFHQGWKDCAYDCLKISTPAAIIEVQGYQYSALKEMASLAAVIGEKILAGLLSKRAENLKNQFNKKFWMPEKGYYALALDAEKKQRKAITSNPGHLLFTGILERGKEKRVVARLFMEDMFTPFGIRTHSVREPDFNPKSSFLGPVWPHDNWLIAQGLKKLGYEYEYQKIKTAILAAYNELGFIPELYVVIDNKITLKRGEKKPICHPQAWSSGALLNFLYDN